jgi:hypothetical protein
LWSFDWCFTAKKKCIKRKKPRKFAPLITLQATYNLQQVISFDVKAEGSGADSFLGCREEKRKRMAPTHARIITPFVPLGMFTEEQIPQVYEFKGSFTSYRCHTGSF